MDGLGIRKKDVEREHDWIGFFNTRCGHRYPSIRGHKDHWTSKDICHEYERIQGGKVQESKT